MVSKVVWKLARFKLYNTFNILDAHPFVWCIFIIFCLPKFQKILLDFIWETARSYDWQYLYELPLLHDCWYKWFQNISTPVSYYYRIKYKKKWSKL